MESPTFVQGRVRRRGWTRVAHGLYVPVDGHPDAPLHALAAQLHKRSGFTHITAVRLRGWWLPPLPDGLPELAAQDTRNRPRRSQLRMIRTTPAPVVTRVRGLPVVSSLDVLLALARHFGLVDVVVFLDSALHRGDLSCDDLAFGLQARRHGVRRLRAAAALADGRSESPFESLLRLLHTACEIPVAPQFEIRTGGRFIARADLRLLGTRVIHEYDGAVHRGRDQHRADLRRDRDIAASGWERRGFTDHEVLRRPVEILREADRALGRAHDPARVDAWYALLRESCFTAAGRSRLLRRLRPDLAA